MYVVSVDDEYGAFVRRGREDNVPLDPVSAELARQRDLEQSAYENALVGNLDYERTLELLEKQQAYNAYQARLQREWQADLSNTAYSRAVADLHRAGLNPYAVLSSGGAVVPSGSAASASLGSASTSSASANVLSSRLSSAAQKSVAYINASASRDVARINAIGRMVASVLSGSTRLASAALL